MACPECKDGSQFDCASCGGTGVVREITELEAVLSQSITWALMTFPKETIQDQCGHLGEELNELAKATEAAEKEAPGASLEHISEELADCVMLSALIGQRLMDVAREANIDLAGAVYNKLERNRKRLWTRTPDGYYRSLKCAVCGADAASQDGTCKSHPKEA